MQLMQPMGRVRLMANNGGHGMEASCSRAPSPAAWRRNSVPDHSANYYISDRDRARQVA